MAFKNLMFKIPTLAKLKYKKNHLKKLKKLYRADFKQDASNNQLPYLIFIRFTLTRLVTEKQVSCLRKFLLKRTTRLLRLYYKAYPHTMLTAKPPEMRMGKGKGPLAQWVLAHSGGGLFCVLLVSPLQQQFLVYDMLYSLKYRLHAGITIDSRV